MSTDSNGGREFPTSRWRYIDRLLAAYGHPKDKAGRKWLRELRDRAVAHEVALRRIEDMDWEDDIDARKIARDALNV